MTPDEALVSDEDVADLNRETLARTATVTRHVGTALVVLGMLCGLAWLWILARQQHLFGDGDPSSGLFGAGPDLGPLARVDSFASSLGFLANAGLVAGIGLGLRMLAEFLLMRAGGSLTGLQAGEPWPVDADGDSDQPEDES